LVGEWDSKDTIAVVVIDDEDVVVACTGWSDESAGEIHVGLSSGFHQGSITVVGTFALVKGQGKSVIIRGTDGVGVLVECWFIRVWSKWPLIVASDSGGCFCREARVNPANSGRWPRQRASSRVDRVRLKRAAWANATRLAAEAVPRVALALAGGGGKMLSSQSCDLVVCWP